MTEPSVGTMTELCCTFGRRVPCPARKATSFETVTLAATLADSRVEQLRLLVPRFVERDPQVPPRRRTRAVMIERVHERASGLLVELATAASWRSALTGVPVAAIRFPVRHHCAGMERRPRYALRSHGSLGAHKRASYEADRAAFARQAASSMGSSNQGVS
jgi:hypothetical protein